MSCYYIDGHRQITTNMPCMLPSHMALHKFSYLSRTCTVPNTDHLLQPLEDCICSKLIPALTSREPLNASVCELFTLPVRLGGLGIVSPTAVPSSEYNASHNISTPRKDLILQQYLKYPPECLEVQLEAKREARKQNCEKAKISATRLRAILPHSLQRAMDLKQEKGSSSWLTALPLEEFGFIMHKGAFRDAIALRYAWLPIIAYPIYLCPWYQFLCGVCSALSKGRVSYYTT